MWKPIPGRFKDYIAMPKPNMYQSLHTTVIGPEGEIFEVQIRTWDMHRTAEYGIAAHWKYKEGSSKSDNFDQKLTWLRQLMEWQKDLKDPKEFMETLKLDLFTDEVYVFTPKGDVINLPSGSTPIDFAYRVHTAIGNSCIGAKVDGRIVPLDYKLKNGNIVEILTSPNGSPSRDWLKIVKSSQARNKIRQWFKRELKEQNIDKGKELLEKELKKRGYKVPEALKDEWLKNIATKISLNSVDDLYAGLGYGNITLSQVMSKFREYYKEYFKIEDDNLTSEIKIKEKAANKPKENVDQGVIVKGVDNIKVRFAKCCNPVPGDEIVGYITRGRGLSVHRKDCPNVNIIGEPDRFMEVSWNTNKRAEYQAEIQIKGVDRPGLLAAITQKITDVGLSLVSLSARTNKEKLAVMNIVLEIKDIEQLKDLMNKIRKIQGVIDVYRVIS
jgi:GTP pyrophosphokinase